MAGADTLTETRDVLPPSPERSGRVAEKEGPFSDAEFARGLLQMRAGDGAALRKFGETLASAVGQQDAAVMADLAKIERDFFGLADALSEALEPYAAEDQGEPEREDPAALSRLEEFLRTGRMAAVEIAPTCSRQALDAYRKAHGPEAFFKALYKIDKFSGYLSDEWRESLTHFFRKSDEEFFDEKQFSELSARMHGDPETTGARDDSQEAWDRYAEDLWFVDNVLEANHAVVGRKIDSLIESVESLRTLSQSDAAEDARRIGTEAMGRNAADWAKIRTILGALRENSLTRGMYLSDVSKMFASETLLFPMDMGTFDSPLSNADASDLFAKYAVTIASQNPAAIRSTVDRFVACGYAGPADVERVVPAALDALYAKNRADFVRKAVEAFSGSDSARTVDAAIIVAGGSKLAEEAIARQAARVPELDTEIVDTWKRCSYPSTAERTRAIRNNLDRMDEIEKERPGCAKVLREEFGIENFARYPKELLTDQYDARDDKALPYGIVINPKADHNGAFSGGPDGGAIGTVWRELKGKYRLRVFEASSRFGVARTLVKTERRYQHDGGGKISFAMIGGHGEPKSIQFGSGENAVKLTSRDLGGTAAEEAKNRFFEPNPTIILSSCSTGARGGIGQGLSEVLGARVIGPDVPTPLPSVTVSLDTAGKPRFEVRYQNAKTMAYQDGEQESATGA